MEMLSCIGHLCAQAKDDPDIRCIVMTGNGADFCAGGEVADFAFEEIHFGTFPLGGGLFRFVRAAGRSNALRHALTGDTFDTREALRMKVVAEVRPAAEALAWDLELYSYLDALVMRLRSTTCLRGSSGSP